MDHSTGRIRLDRTLFTATQYPADYGYVEQSLGADDDRWTRWCWSRSRPSPGV